MRLVSWRWLFFEIETNSKDDARAGSSHYSKIHLFFLSCCTGDGSAMGRHYASFQAFKSVQGAYCIKREGAAIATSCSSSTCHPFLLLLLTQNPKMTGQSNAQWNSFLFKKYSSPTVQVSSYLCRGLDGGTFLNDMHAWVVDFLPLTIVSSFSILFIFVIHHFKKPGTLGQKSLDTWPVQSADHRIQQHWLRGLHSINIKASYKSQSFYKMC